MKNTVVLKVNPYPKFQNETFLHIEPFQPLKVGDVYRFVEYPDCQFIRQVVCVSVQYLHLGDIPDSMAFLDKDCDKQILFKIFEQKKIYKTSPVYVGIFTNSGNSKTHFYAPIIG